MKNNNGAKRLIYTRNHASYILDLFEEVLDMYDIKIPDATDDGSDPDRACLYGDNYSQLLDDVEAKLINIASLASRGYRIHPYVFESTEDESKPKKSVKNGQPRLVDLAPVIQQAKADLKEYLHKLREKYGTTGDIDHEDTIVSGDLELEVQALNWYTHTIDLFESIPVIDA